VESDEIMEMIDTFHGGPNTERGAMEAVYERILKTRDHPLIQALEKECSELRRQLTAAPVTSGEASVVEALTHGRCCSAGFDLDANCTCGLQYRIYLQTEQEMHAAWRKRAEEAESALVECRRAVLAEAGLVKLEDVEKAIRETWLEGGDFHALPDFVSIVFARLSTPKTVKEHFTCKFCGASSEIDPSDQILPPDYCHTEDHFSTKLRESEGA
jgi:hypothetical protein